MNLPEVTKPLLIHNVSTIAYDTFNMTQKYDLSDIIKKLLTDPYCMALIINDDVIFNFYNEHTIPVSNMIHQRMMREYIQKDVFHNLLMNADRMTTDYKIVIYMYSAVPWAMHIKRNLMQHKYEIEFTQAKDARYKLKKDFSISI